MKRRSFLQGLTALVAGTAAAKDDPVNLGPAASKPVFDGWPDPDAIYNVNPVDTPLAAVSRGQGASLHEWVEDEIKAERVIEQVEARYIATKAHFDRQLS